MTFLQAFLEALESLNGNKLRSAIVLGVSRRSLYRLIDKYNITPSEIDGIS